MIEESATPKELRKRFAEAKSDSNSFGVASTENTPNASELLGLTFNDMEEVVIADISGMISKSYRKALDGYVLCLSRIIQHEKAWLCILKAFHLNHETVPKKYYAQFGQTTEEQTDIRKKGFVVK